MLLPQSYNGLGGSGTVDDVAVDNRASRVVQWWWVKPGNGL